MPSPQPKQAHEPGNSPHVALRSALRASDRAAIEAILRAVGVFSEGEIEVGLELVDETLRPGPATDYRWFLAEDATGLVGFVCYGPVPMTEGTFDLYWLAVHPRGQGQAVARGLEQRVCETLREQSARWLLAETSTSSAFEPARRFYARQGYEVLSSIPDFYRPGVGRVALGKRLDGG